MLTIDKINIYKKYRGYYDGYYIQNKEILEKRITDDEWILLDDIIQDIFLVKKGVTSKAFENNLNIRLLENCENNETIEELKKLEIFLHEQNFE